MKRQAVAIGLLLLVSAGALSMARVGSSSPGDIARSEAELEQVVVQLQELDGRLGLAVEAFNAATLKLKQIDAALAVADERLRLAKQSSRSAQKALADRVVALYKADEEGTLEVVLGAASLGDLIDRVDAVDRIASRDEQIVLDVKAARNELRQRQLSLQRSLDRQKRIVGERRARQAKIERMITERKQLYESKKDELDRLIIEEAERQERLRREAEQRLAAEAAARERRAAQEQRRREREARQRAESNERSAPEATTPGPAPSQPPAPTQPPAPPSPSSPSAPPESPQYTGVVDIAMQYLGIPYRWAGASPETGFDCSGFVMYIYAKVGVGLPHHAATQYRYGAHVPRGDLEPGDLVFFNGLGHNGIYIGGGQFIHSPHTGDVVKISSLSDSWYARTYVGARRL